MPVYFNQQLAAGRALICLRALISDKVICGKAQALALHFKKRLRQDEKDAYVWDYWYDKSLKRYAGVEDYSHGAIDVEFAVEAFSNKSVFNREDIIRFLRTYHQNIFRNGEVVGRVDGSGRAKNATLSRGWLDLSMENCSVWLD